MIVWIDLETTRLLPERDCVLEVACVITDDEFAEIARHVEVLAMPEDRPLAEWDPYVQQMHARNGLINECYETRSGPANADDRLREFMITHGAIGATLAGSTVSFDREFMRVHLPTSFGLLHYHNLDVTSLNEIARRTWPKIHDARPGRGADVKHRALDDVLASLEVARYYRRALADAADRDRADLAEATATAALEKCGQQAREIIALRERIRELYETSNA